MAYRNPGWQLSSLGNDCLHHVVEQHRHQLVGGEGITVQDDRGGITETAFELPRRTSRPRSCHPHRVIANDKLAALGSDNYRRGAFRSMGQINHLGPADDVVPKSMPSQ